VGTLTATDQQRTSLTLYEPAEGKLVLAVGPMTEKLSVRCTGNITAGHTKLQVFLVRYLVLLGQLRETDVKEIGRYRMDF